MTTTADDRSRKIDAIVQCRLQGADETEIRRLASLNGWDTSIIESGLARRMSTTATVMYGYDGNGYNVGDRVELHPSTDLWMRGARYGDVLDVARKWRRSGSG